MERIFKKCIINLILVTVGGSFASCLMCDPKLQMQLELLVGFFFS